jgi:glucose/arabinose dehydrogenase
MTARLGCVGGWAMITLAIVAGGAGMAQGATYPRGFRETPIAAGLALPTAFAFFPDGRIVIAEKAGVVRMVKDGRLLSTPFVDVSDRVNDYWDRGLLGIAVDPNQAANPYVYLLYTFENDPGDYSGPKTARLTRLRVQGDRANPDSEVVLVGKVVGRSCDDFPAGADCIPSDAPSHTVGAVRFAGDTLFVTTGDGASFNTVTDQALRTQDVDSLAGKLLRVRRNGLGVSSNPFWNGNARANRSKVWAYGFRNAYRFTLRPGTRTPTPYVGDVGWDTHEEINVGTAGANFGWPCYEGAAQQPGYAPYPLCRALYGKAGGAGQARAPLVDYLHDGSAAVTGGAFATSTSYPAPHRGAYFFADYAQEWLQMLQVDRNNALVPGSLREFATGLGGPVDVQAGPDGLIYVLAIGSGRLFRIDYSENTPPVAVAAANRIAGLRPLDVQLSSAGSHDPDDDAVTYEWDFGDGTSASGPQASHRYNPPDAGVHVYQAVLTVRDDRGGVGRDTITITVGNRLPVARILTPSGSRRYKVGDVISYSGSGTDPDEGALPGSALSWQVLLHHCPGGDCHTHPFEASTGESGSFTVPDHGDESYFELLLTATDGGGLTRTVSRKIMPREVALRFTTRPPGLTIVYDGTSHVTPVTRRTIAGSFHTIDAPSPQGIHSFLSWSDRNAQQHGVQAVAGKTYTATFCPVGQYRAEYFANTALDGPPVFTRCEAAIRYNWGTRGPGHGLARDSFSVRWTGRFIFGEGPVTFRTLSDDGLRLFVDGALVIDFWNEHGATPFDATRALSAGEHEVTVEYFEAGGDAVARVSW